MQLIPHGLCGLKGKTLPTTVIEYPEASECIQYPCKHGISKAAKLHPEDL